MMAAVRQGWFNMRGRKPRPLATVDLVSFPAAKDT